MTRRGDQVGAPGALPGLARARNRPKGPGTSSVSPLSASAPVSGCELRATRAGGHATTGRAPR